MSQSSSDIITGFEAECRHDVVEIADFSDLRDESVGDAKHLNGVLAQDVGHQVDVMDHAIVEDPAGCLQVR